VSRDDDDDIARAARGLRREWDSPDLWPRIEAALAAEVEAARRRRRSPGPAAWLTLAAAAAALVLGLAVLLRVRAPETAAPDAPRRLLSERALREVERSEGDYVRSIEALSRLAEPRVEEPESPLMMSYREKLVVLDSAIAECRARIDRNRFNARLRQELLSLYQDKQRTLQQMIEEETDAL
jgi:hypothetical protein